jgi:hypothetical protein
MNFTERKGLTLHQWIVREAARCQKEADRLWDELDNLQPAEDFERIYAEYNAVCDYMDALEDDPERLFFIY